MKVVILCGGSGERFYNAYPKPLNRVCGRMIGEWLCEHLQFNELIWLLNPRLYDYSIEEEIIRWTGHNNNTFIKLPFETSDPCQSLDIGLNYFNFDEPFLCLDNDNIYLDDLHQFESLTEPEAAILVHKMEENKKYSSRYGFVKIIENRIVQGKEKITGWGENAFSYGGYWFKSPALCKEWLNLEKEFYSKDRSLVNLICKSSNYIVPIYAEKTFSIGTPEDCVIAETEHNEHFGWKNTRIVVDLDNTLLRYPYISQDYNSSYPQEHIVEWLSDKQKKGATICVSTARHMKTCNNNVAKVVGSIGLNTLLSLTDLPFDIDEIDFGKPNGDIYLDDKSTNPYDNNWITYCGDWQDQSYKPINLLPVTRADNVSVKMVGHLFKIGSVKELIAQASYYQIISQLNIQHLFPKCYNITQEGDRLTLELEYIKGIPGSYLWAYNTWGEKEYILITNALDQIHQCKFIEDDITSNDIIAGYFDKVKERQRIYAIFKELDEEYRLWEELYTPLKSYHPQTITHIHGDSFLGNIIYTMKNQIKLIDMKGELNGKITSRGDPNYDYAKLAMSFLSFDSIVYNLPLRSIEDGFKWVSRLDNASTILDLSLILMYATLPYYQNKIAASIISRIKEVLIYRNNNIFYNL